MSIFSSFLLTEDPSKLLLLSFFGSGGAESDNLAKGLRVMMFLKPLSMELRKVLFHTSVAVMQ